MSQRGPRLGWILGGIGGLLWIPILSAVLWHQGRTAAGIAGLAFFFWGILYIFRRAPWIRADIPFRRLYAGLLGIMLAAAVVMLFFWRPPGLWPWNKAYYLVYIFPLLIPFFTMGSRTWSDLHGGSPEESPPSDTRRNTRKDEPC